MISLPRLASFTRPNDTTAYASGDALSASTSAGVAMQLPVAVPAFPGIRGSVTRVLVQKSTNTTTNSAMKLLLFSADPGAANDNAALSVAFPTSLNNPTFLGSIDVATFSVPTGLAYAVSDNTLSTAVPISKQTLDSTIYGVLVATAAYSPGAQEKFIVQVFIQPESL